MNVDELIWALQKLGPENGDRKVSILTPGPYHQELSSCKLVLLKQDELAPKDGDPIHIKGMTMVEIQ